MRIGELAHRTGTSVRSLRYYEQVGLLSPRRAENGYRDYDEQAVTVVHNVRRLLDSGLTSAEIKQIGDCLYTGDLAQTPVCTWVVGLYEERIAAVDANLTALAKRRTELQTELDGLRERLHQGR